jgi:hypothetical protein
MASTNTGVSLNSRNSVNFLSHTDGLIVPLSDVDLETSGYYYFCFFYPFPSPLTTSTFNLQLGHHSESVLQNLTLSYKDYIISMSRYIVSLNLKEVNEIFRRAIIRAYFEPELLKMDYHKSSVKHPLILDDGLTVEDILHLYFDISTGIDYPDGDEWFTVEYLLPFNVKLPDNLKGLDYFTTLSVSDGKHFWRHRELVRFKMGKSKRLAESLTFIDKKYKELSKAVHDSPVINQLK